MNPRPPSRGTKDYLLPFLIIISIGIVAALSIRLWGLWVGEEEGSGSLALSGQAELSDISGGVEVYLPAAEAWKITSDTATISTGESVRSDGSGSAKLTFDDGSIITLGNSTEVQIEELRNSISKKNIKISLERGSIWAALGTMNADVEISSDLLVIRDADGQLLLSSEEKSSSNEKANLATAVVGGFTAAILDQKEDDELKHYVVDAGETLEVSERRINLIRIGGDVDLVKTTPEEISGSQFYLTMMGETPVESEIAETENEDIESDDTLDPDLVTTDAERDQLTAPFITTSGGTITAVTDPIKVSGKVSPKIVKVEVSYENDDPFTLSKFEAGSGEWSYNAAEDYGNLKVGINTYTVIGYDEADNATPPANFQIIFDPEGVEELVEEAAEEEAAIESTDGVPAVGGSTFDNPVVTQPADGATFSEAPIAFSGTVPAGTAKVIINEYQLTSFESGDTTWSYNADPKYENLDVGENEYDIVAVSENGDKSQVTIKITFEPSQE